MTPADFDRKMEHICKFPTRDLVADAGIALIQEALGMNAHAYMPGIDLLCRRLRQLKPRKPFGPPRIDSVSSLVDGVSTCDGTFPDSIRRGGG